MKITPLEKQQVSGPAVAIYEELEQKRGTVINFFKVLAYKPEILKSFMEFYQHPKVAGSNPAPATMNDEGLADVAAANPFRLPRLHPGIDRS